MWYAFVNEPAFLSDFGILPNGKMALPNGEIDFTERSNGFYQTVKCIGTDRRVPSILPVNSEPSQKDFRDSLSFARELDAIIPVSVNPRKAASDWKAYQNVGKMIIERIIAGKTTVAAFEQVKQAAIRAKNDTTRPDVPAIAKFFKIIHDELNYRRPSKGGKEQTVGNILKGMAI